MLPGVTFPFTLWVSLDLCLGQVEFCLCWSFEQGCSTGLLSWVSLCGCNFQPGGSWGEPSQTHSAGVLSAARGASQESFREQDVPKGGRTVTAGN